MGLDHLARETLREDPALASHIAASETPCSQPDPELPTMSRQNRPRFAGSGYERRTTAGRTWDRGSSLTLPRACHRDTVGSDFVMIDDQSGRDERERRHAKGHAIWPSMARPPTPLESLGIHRPVHQMCARAKFQRRLTAQSGEQRRGSVALIVVSHGRALALLHWQAGLGAVEGLDLASSRRWRPRPRGGAGSCRGRRHRRAWPRSLDRSNA